MTVKYHLSPKERQGNVARRKLARRRWKHQLKLNAGGKCSRCGYDRCLDALHFHHPNNDKEVTVCNASQALATQEAKKCILVCANCHAELHAKN